MPEFTHVPRAAPTTISGLRAPDNVIAARLVPDVHEDIFLYMPSASPLSTLTAKVRRKREATQRRFDILEKDEYPRVLKLAAASAVADTVLDVEAGQGARVIKRHTFRNTRTSEVVLVTATPGADAITVVRGIGGLEADMNIGDTLVLLGPTFPDGADFGDMRSVAEANIYNYTEIVRTEFGFSGRDEFTELYGGRDIPLEIKVQGIEHAKSLELKYYFGKRHTRTGDNGREETYTGGLEYFIASNVWDVTGIQLSERAFVEFLEEAMRWGEGGNQQGMGTKYLFMSSRWATEIEFWAKNKLEYRPLDTQIGLKAAEYVTVHGTVMLIKSPILDQVAPDMSFLVDLNHVRFVYHRGRDTKLLRDREVPGLDGSQMEYLTDFGCEVSIEASHAILKGLS